MTKGYDGVKRWTKQVRAVVKSFIGVCNTVIPKEGKKKKLKMINVLNVHGQVKEPDISERVVWRTVTLCPAQVDLFSKSLLLVPIHLEVHWCLVAADNARKKICLYDSQGNALQKVARVRAGFSFFGVTHFYGAQGGNYYFRAGNDFWIFASPCQAFTRLL